MHSTSAVRPYRVLSLDGGGMRGIYTASFLEHLASQFATLKGVPALDSGTGFDLITGTSTGAIVGCALAVGRPMSAVAKLYHQHGAAIFPLRITGKRSPIYQLVRAA